MANAACSLALPPLRGTEFPGFRALTPDVVHTGSGENAASASAPQSCGSNMRGLRRCLRRWASRVRLRSCSSMARLRSKSS
jgi:hypothetical protein